MSDGEDRSVYQGPGLWEGCLIVPAILGAALLSAILVTLMDGLSDGLRVGIVSVVVGVVTWLALWELFARLHPLFSQGSDARLKEVAIFGGPPLMALIAAVLASW